MSDLDDTTDGTSNSRILLVDDVKANLKVLLDVLGPVGYELAVAADGETALKATAATTPDLILLDVAMPGLNGFEVCRRLREQPATRDIPVIFITAHDETASVVEGFRAGGVDYITKPFAREEVQTRVRTHLRISRLTRDLADRNRQLQQEIARREAADERLDQLSSETESRWDIDGFVGRSSTIQQILDDVRQLQGAAATVLIEGESGTGKELIARAIHYGSRRGDKPFIALNCSAIPAELAESTLFGHVKGAFSGAQATRRGAFCLADGGTLFLDEIADMPPALQPKLLRVLEEGLVTPVGGEREQAVDVRVVAATNAHLQQRIDAGHFRRDLYFRLARFQVRLPPLRERPGDIALLAEHFLELFGVDMGIAEPTIDAAALEVLEAYGFPGNVRELKNIIEHALIKSRGAPIEAQHLHLMDMPEDAPSVAAPRPVAPEALTQQEREARVLQYVRTHGSINNEQCRDLLGANYNQVSYLLKKMTRHGVLVRMGERRGAFYRIP